jgi:hypothetical protein
MKRQAKKLMLNKETVRSLVREQLRAAAGGEANVAGTNACPTTDTNDPTACEVLSYCVGGCRWRSAGFCSLAR